MLVCTDLHEALLWVKHKHMCGTEQKYFVVSQHAHDLVYHLELKRIRHLVVLLTVSITFPCFSMTN